MCKNGGLTGSQFLMGVAVTFLGGLRFLNKKINQNLKYLMAKEIYTKIFLSVIAKNLNWKI